MRVDRLEHKLGIRASDTATIIFENCRVPKENLLGSPEVDPKQGFAGAMATFDNTRPLVASMAVGCAAAALDRRDHVIPEDVQQLVVPMLAHRVILSADQQHLAQGASDVLEQLAHRVRVPSGGRAGAHPGA